MQVRIKRTTVLWSSYKYVAFFAVGHSQPEMMVRLDDYIFNDGFFELSLKGEIVMTGFYSNVRSVPNSEIVFEVEE